MHRMRAICSTGNGSAGSSETSTDVSHRAQRQAGDAARARTASAFRRAAGAPAAIVQRRSPADGDLLAPRRRARQQHAGDIGARDDRAPASRSPSAARRTPRAARGCPAPATSASIRMPRSLLSSGILGREPAPDRRHFRRGFRQRHARLQTAAGEQPMRRAIRERRRRRREPAPAPTRRPRECRCPGIPRRRPRRW